ncbi:ankyrin repeat-containing protein [Anaeramoeba flamelloides]|uniref:Ankyrin repeat-containing protein n=1 Tax=Anaeramoeba flamelloides TaxID=1746091 RepID=A0AAV8AGE7_9EUKA|nr:ankyrin repeat-containing protein [Anaeramoeba flamelloides]
MSNYQQNNQYTNFNYEQQQQQQQRQQQQTFYNELDYQQEFYQDNQYYYDENYQNQEMNYLPQETYEQNYQNEMFYQQTLEEQEMQLQYPFQQQQQQQEQQFEQYTMNEIDLFNLINSPYKQEHLQSIEKLIKQDTKIINKPFYGQTLISYAVHNKCIEFIKQLIKLGADLNLKTSATPLNMSIDGGKTEIYQLLIEKGADLNLQDSLGESPIMCACKNSNIELMEFLIKKNVDLKLKNEFGQTVLFYGILQNSYEMTKLLLEAGCDPNIKDNNVVPLLFAACYQDVDHSIIELLMKHKTFINSLNKERETVLFDLIKMGNLNKIQTLVEFNADLTHQNKDGLTPFWMVWLFTEKNKFSIIDCLLQNGSNIHQQNFEGYTIFDLIEEEENLNLLNTYDSISQEFYSLFKSEIGTNATITCLDDEKIKIHYNFIMSRITRDLFLTKSRKKKTKENEKENEKEKENENEKKKTKKKQKVLKDFFNEKKKLDLFKEYSKNDISLLLKFLYTGVAEISSLYLISNIMEKLGHKKLNFKKKKAKNGLINDLKRLYRHQKSKDFKFIIGNKSKKIHREVLIARSVFFRDLFQTKSKINEEFKEFELETDISLQSIDLFIEFLYHDKIFSVNYDDINIQEIKKLASIFKLSESNYIWSYLYLLNKLHDEKLLRSKEEKNKQIQLQQKNEENENENENLININNQIEKINLNKN